jgi:excinuclease ABC subunit A
MTDDEIIESVLVLVKRGPTKISAPLVRGSKGSHTTLLKLLSKQFGRHNLLVNGKQWNGRKLNAETDHDIEVVVGELSKKSSRRKVREAIQNVFALGANTAFAHAGELQLALSRTRECSQCGTWYDELEPKHFRMRCEECEGQGCAVCGNTGLQVEAAMIKWQGYNLAELLNLSVNDVGFLFETAEMPSTADRLRMEVVKRLKALRTMGLGYIQLNRPSPSLSRGESQRVRLAISLAGQLEDMAHLLDEPSIGQHPSDVQNLLPAFQSLPGPVIYVEHDRVAAASADRAIDLGPGAGEEGGQIVFEGTPRELWKADTLSGQFFSLRSKVPKRRTLPEPSDFLTIHAATMHNLQGIDVQIPLGRLTVITGVSGSGKSTLIEHVLVPTLEQKKPVGCKGIKGKSMKPVLVDQAPIGKNPRSNPATYTKLSDIIRDLYASETKLTQSHFSFNRPEGMCLACKGIGAVEVKMRYLPSIWITCSACEGRRFKEEVLEARVRFGDRHLSIADFYKLSIGETHSVLADDDRLSDSKRRAAKRILDALVTIGLSYLRLGQPSPNLSGGEAQRVKLAKFLGKRALSDKFLVLDEPSTGLHAADLHGLLSVLDTLVTAGATVVVVEHNTDVIRSADWVIDLGPGAGPKGGEIVYAGAPHGLIDVEASLTGRALKDDGRIVPRASPAEQAFQSKDCISIVNASANNLKSVSIDIPKSRITVVTGPSGSGKSSLVRDVLQAEAERRFFESLSMYERQGTHEGPKAPVDSVSGLGVSVAISSRRRRGAGYWSVYAVRTTVGVVTEISNHLAALFSILGEHLCPNCQAVMNRRNSWVCPECDTRLPLYSPRDFSRKTYTSACEECSGIGHQQKPVPEKLIIHPEKPICAGAMYSPGYFPKGYFCQPPSVAAGALEALGERYGFDPKTTPWKNMTSDAQHAFLFGDPEPLDITYQGTRRGKRVEVNTRSRWAGFYRWVSDWDVGGTYTRRETCLKCGGSGLRPEFLNIKLLGHNIDEFSKLTISKLKRILYKLKLKKRDVVAETSLGKIMTRLGFLEKVGLAYIHLDREASTLSAGEAQRVILSSLLGSGLTSLTVLLDEPTRGMHPSEVEALVDALTDLRNEGNTVVVVEHDPVIIRAADEIVDMGPGSGNLGGELVAQGTPSQIMKTDTITARWLRGEKKTKGRLERRSPIAWMTIKGARENNLQNLTMDIPLGVLAGICGVSGSGKSTLFIDTIGRELAPKKFTTSVSYEPIQPGVHDSIEGRPKRTIILDQGRKGIRSPGHALGLFKPLTQAYAESEDAKALGLDYESLSRHCSACEGHGRIKIEMGFLPNVYETCETCLGTGHPPEAWDVRISGISLPELNRLTLAELYEMFKENEKVVKRIRPALEVGLDYLALRQPSVTLSGGEIQRLKIAQEFSKGGEQGNLFIIDEPTVGQHLEDVERLIEVLHRLVDRGNSVMVVEHHPNVLAACDFLIELGPGGGPDGGRVVAAGTPEELAVSDTPTSGYIREVLEGSS